MILGGRSGLLWSPASASLLFMETCQVSWPLSVSLPTEGLQRRVLMGGAGDRALWAVFSPTSPRCSGEKLWVSSSSHTRGNEEDSDKIKKLLCIEYLLFIKHIQSFHSKLTIALQLLLLSPLSPLPQTAKLLAAKKGRSSPSPPPPRVDSEPKVTTEGCCPLFPPHPCWSDVLLKSLHGTTLFSFY